MDYTWLSVPDARRNVGWVTHYVDNLGWILCLVSAVCNFLSCEGRCCGDEGEHADDSFHNKDSTMKPHFHNCVFSSRPIVFHLVDLRLPADLYLYREAIDLNGASVPSE